MSVNPTLTVLDIPLFNLEASVAEAQTFLGGKNYSHLPVVNENNLWDGNISCEEIQNSDPCKKISDLLYTAEHFFIPEDSDKSAFECMDLFAQFNSNIIPFIAADRKLLGIIYKDDLLLKWADTLFFTERGKTILIEKAFNQYSLSEITQIVESNNAKLLGIFTLSEADKSTQLLIKTNNINTKSIIEDLRRYQYTILSKHEEDTYYTDLKNQSDYLNKYLNI